MEIKRGHVVVAGGSYGIGAHIAKCFMYEGAHVFITGRDPQHLEDVQQVVHDPRASEDAQCHFGLVEMNDLASIADFRDLVQKHTNSIDLLVNAIGGADTFGTFDDLTDEDWMRTIDLNLMSAVRIMREFIPMLQASEENTSSIINISSLPAHQPGRFNPHYAAAKAGLDTLSKMMANELAPKVRVNVIRPSTIMGGGWERNIADRARREGVEESIAKVRMFNDERKKTPLGRPGTLDEVYSVVRMLATNEFMTGQFINVDGGQTRTVS